MRELEGDGVGLGTFGSVRPNKRERENNRSGKERWVKLEREAERELRLTARKALDLDL